MTKTETELFNKIKELEEENRQLKIKGEAFDLLADHVTLLKFLTGACFHNIPMTKTEIEKVALAMGIPEINWIDPKKEKETEEEPKKEEVKKKKRWFRKE